MSSDLSGRSLRVAQWWFQETLNHMGELPQGKSAVIHMEILMDMASADGVFAPAEREWVIRFSATIGKYFGSLLLK